MFKGRKIAIASMHQKEKVISPLLIKELEMQTVVPEINTDLLGTFSGEVERNSSPYKTAWKKCMLAMNISRCDVAISSEGSFGAHPTIPFVNANEELVLLVDRKNNLEFFGRALTTETNFSGASITTKKEAYDFANNIGFPEHAIIVKNQEKKFDESVKGINSETHLEKVLDTMFSKYTDIWIETDMRALYNPTRMKIIEQATKNLIEKIHSKCPNCFQPGFWIVEAIKGLPCSNCKFPTRSVKAHLYQCKSCQFELTKEYPTNKYHEEPTYCDFCNP